MPIQKYFRCLRTVKVHSSAQIRLTWADRPVKNCHICQQSSCVTVRYALILSEGGEILPQGF